MNLGDYDGRTALHLAAAEGHARCVKFLLDTCGVKHDPKDRQAYYRFSLPQYFHNCIQYNSLFSQLSCIFQKYEFLSLFLKRILTFQVGSDSSHRSNSVQAHESGSNDQTNCQGQRVQEQGRGSGTIMCQMAS